MPQLSLFHVQGGEVKQGFSCTACALHQNADLITNCMKGTGNARPKFFFVGHAPGREDDVIGKPMTGANGREFHSLLKDAGFYKEEVHFSNCIKCAPHDLNATKTHWNACRQHFFAELNMLRPDVVVTVGADATSWVTGHTGVTKLVRKGLPVDGAEQFTAYPLRQPAGLFHKEGAERFELRRQMVDDLRWLRDLVLRGNANRKTSSNVDYQICRTPEDVDELFAELEQRDNFAIDLETTNLFPDAHERILAIGFSWGSRMGRALPLWANGITTLHWWDDDYLENNIIPRLQSLLRRKKVFGHNLIQFDQKWGRAKLDVTNFNIDFDTQYCHYVLNEERGTHDLEQLALLYTDMTPWKKDFNTADTQELCTYLCKDVDATYRLREVLLPQLNDRQLWLLNELLIPLSKELFEVSWHGVGISEPNLREFSDRLQKQIDKEKLALRADKFIRLYELSENTQLNIEAPEQLRTLFEKYLKWPMIKKTDGGKYSTDKDVLAHYQDEPVASGILRIRRLQKLKDAYCDLLMREARNGRIHTSYRTHGTVTGRLASSDPNMQVMPRDDTLEKVFGKDKVTGLDIFGNPATNYIKGLFSSESGSSFIEADFSQAELRCLASISGDVELIGIYLRGEDAHTATAARVYGIPLAQVTKGQRSNAKAVNFGIVYGMTEEGLIAKFEAAGSTAQEAKKFLSLHKKTFVGVWKFMDEQEVIIRKQGFQETYFGRRRRYQDIDHEAIRQAYNFPIQSLASDLTLISLVRIAHALRQLNLPGRVVLTIHDSIIVEAKDSHIWEIAELMQHIMQTINFPWMRVSMVADFKVGVNWANLKEMHIATRMVEA